MDAERMRGTLLGVSHILTNAPFFILACALFWRQRRVSPLKTAAVFGAFVFAHGASDFFLTAFYTGDVWWLPIQFIVFVVGAMGLPLLMFRVTFARALYCFLLLRAAYTAVLYIVLNCFRIALPGQYIGFDETPLYTLTSVLAMAAVFPLLWRYFTGRLREAFSELSDATIRQLCVPPVLFFMLDQIYSVMRDSLEFDSLQTASIFLLMLLTGFATYYVNLRMVMDSAKHSRLAAEAGIKEQALAAENAALDRLNHMKTELIATVSHETKTPLAVLSVYAELIAKELRRKGVDLQMAKDLDIITEETQRISRLMDELQEHIRTRDEKLSRAQMRLGELVEGVVRLFTPIAQRKGNRLDAYIPDDLPDCYACSGEITQVLFNLLQNANQNTEGGRIDIRVVAQGAQLAVTVSDTGCGIPPALLARIFERGVSTSETGIGLGLVLCKEIIDRHGGEITLQSADGEGTRAQFTLPVWKEEMDGGTRKNPAG